MRVLVTGSTGFLGREVVAAFLRHGHQVRALVRPAGDLAALAWRDQVEVHRGDVRDPSSLDGALDGIEAVVHLGGSPSADNQELFAATVVGTEHLMGAMAAAGTGRLVLASSFSVYDVEGAHDVVSEDSPFEPDPYGRDGYVVAKTWQERVARRLAKEHEIGLTVLRPGLIWGAGNVYVGSLGQRLGPVHLVIGPRTRLRLTYVENCADAFVAATADPRAIGETFNVIDPEHVSAWGYLARLDGASARRSLRVPVPYRLGHALMRTVHAGAARLLGGSPKLPSILMPHRFTSRFKPLRYADDRLTRRLGWTAPLSFDQAADRAFGTRR